MKCRHPSPTVVDGLEIGAVKVYKDVRYRPNMTEHLQSLLYLAGPLSLLIQILLCVHVYRTGRPFWWIWLIMMGSLIGCSLYVLLEILPGMGGGTATATPSWLIPKRVVIRRARERLEVADTVENRLNLASLLHDQGKKEAAEQVVRDCASGVFRDDPHVVAQVAGHKVTVGKYDEAERLLPHANVKGNRQAARRIELIRARILYGKMNFREALTAFTALKPVILGEEPRYHMAMCHLGLGDPAAATGILEDIMKYYRRGGKLWRRSEREWYMAAKQSLAKIRTGTPPSPWTGHRIWVHLAKDFVRRAWRKLARNGDTGS